MCEKYSKEERLQRACMRVAMHIRGLWEEKGSSDTRLLDALLIPDELTVVGRSKAYTGKGRREHVVPRRVIIQQCHEMLRNGETDQTIAKFIKDHIRIVLITSEEAAQLDSAKGLNLRQGMPADWAFGTNLFMRLDAAGIKWEPV